MNAASAVDLRLFPSRREARASDAARPRPPVDATIRPAREADVESIYGLVSDHMAQGHLLPRSRADIAARIGRFLVAEDGDRVVGCVDLAPLSRRVAEVRSLVVDADLRSCGIARRLVQDVEHRALAAGFESLCAFTHAPGYFVQMGFSIVPHTWLPEKIDADCRSCAQFRQCGQYAVMLPLESSPTLRVPAGSTHA
jgi:amino-acid N-acetyltransferase